MPRASDSPAGKTTSTQVTSKSSSAARAFATSLVKVHCQTPQVTKFCNCLLLWVRCEIRAFSRGRVQAVKQSVFFCCRRLLANGLGAEGGGDSDGDTRHGERQSEVSQILAGLDSETLHSSQQVGVRLRETTWRFLNKVLQMTVSCFKVQEKKYNRSQFRTNRLLV